MTITDHKVGGAVAAAVVAVLLLGACGSSSKPSASTSTTTIAGSGTSDTCKALSDFRSALSSLIRPATLSGGKDSVQAAVDQAQHDLDTLKSDLKSADKPQLDALQSSMDDLKTAVSNINGLSGVGDAIDAGQKVYTNAQDLYRVVQAGCPSS